MRFSKFWSRVVAGVLPFSVIVGQESGQVRSWTNAEGKQVEAVLVQASDTHAVLRLANGSVVDVALTSLSAPDQNLISEMLDAGLVLRPLPETVQIEPIDSTFLFRGLGKPDEALMNTLGAAYTIAKTLPFDLDPQPGISQEVYHVHLIDSAGYRSMLNNRKYDPSLKATAAFLRDEVALFVNHSNIRGDKMTPEKMAEISQEAAKTVLLRWSITLPDWMWDGLAGCFSSFPVQRGVVSMSGHEAGLKQFLVQRFAIDPKSVVATSPANLFAMNFGDWEPTPENRVGAVLLTYFFLHLDPATARGVSFSEALASVESMKEQSLVLLQTEESIAAHYERQRVAYNEAVAGFNKVVDQYKKDYEEYKKNVQEYNAQVGRGVPEEERMKQPVAPEQPKTPVAPVMPASDGAAADVRSEVFASDAAAKILPILKKGRSDEELAAQVVAEFAKIGIPVQFK